MKKVLFVLAALAVMGASAFAEDVTGALGAVGDAANSVSAATGISESLQGVWFDKKYNCNWVFSVNTGSDTFCTLKDADNNATIWTFTKNNTQKLRSEAGSDGFTLSWECEAKNRTYKFTKGISASRDLKLDIFHNVYNERHNATITYVSADARVD